MVTAAYAKALPPEIHQYWSQYDLPPKLFYKLTNPGPIKNPTGTTPRPSRPPSAGGG
ncbi:MAG: hypothetical protein GX489_06490 [Firmicutes bacterium]|nr:hypothetical protein [Bacillota bacterium]